MFGTLKPTRAALDCRTRGEWQRFYCGTCQGIGAQFGLGYRGLLSHDAVFLGLLVDGLQVEAAPPDRTRCPMVPVVHRQTVSPDSVAMRYCAAVQLLLADQWLADRAVDRRSFKQIGAKLARPLIAKPAGRARATLAELGSDLGVLIGFEDRQAALEIRGATGPEDAAQPTAAALGLVFEGIAGLPGVVEQLREETGARAVLERLGRAVGTVIYLVDALEDLDEDRRAGAFNPCLVHDYAGRAQVSAGRVRVATRLLRSAIAELGGGLAALPLRRHVGVLQNILVTQLGGRASLAIAGAERLLDEAGVRRSWLAGLAARSGVLRLSQAMLALSIAIVTGLWARIVTAATETGGSDTDTETGGDMGETGVDVGTSGVEEALGSTGTSGADLGGGGGGGGGCPCFGWFAELLQSCCGGMADACSSFSESLGVCGGCVEGCGSGCNDCGQNCGSGCSGCGSGCSDCGSGCSDGSGCDSACSKCCDCSDICGSCSDCGSCGCGNGCVGCGNCAGGCNGC